MSRMLISDQRRGNSGNMAVVGAKGKGVLLTNTTVTFRPRVVIECSEVYTEAGMQRVDRL